MLSRSYIYKQAKGLYTSVILWGRATIYLKPLIRGQKGFLFDGPGRTHENEFGARLFSLEFQTTRDGRENSLGHPLDNIYTLLVVV